jgi:Rrf2 family protein
MLNKTSISAIRALVYLSEQGAVTCLSPRRIAEALDDSPTYLAKSLRHLVKAGILRAEKGVRGGVRLARRPDEVTLLAVFEACQGAIIGDFCQSSRPDHTHCNFHRAAMELHDVIKGVLSKWTLAHLIEVPGAMGDLGGGETCLMVRGMIPPPAGSVGAALSQIR